MDDNADESQYHHCRECDSEHVSAPPRGRTLRIICQFQDNSRSQAISLIENWPTLSVSVMAMFRQLFTLNDFVVLRWLELCQIRLAEVESSDLDPRFSAVRVMFSRKQRNPEHWRSPSLDDHGDPTLPISSARNAAPHCNNTLHCALA